MARCDQGYLCEVCGEEVDDVAESDLYLRYVLGEVDPETLHASPERHLRCNPTLSQFIVADGFEPVEAGGFFAKAELDPDFVAAEEAGSPVGIAGCSTLPGSGLPLTEYPPPEVRARWQGPAVTPPEPRA